MNALAFDTTALRSNRETIDTALEESCFIQQLLADDAGAWREFSARYSRLIVSCITRVTGRFRRVSPDDVRDIHATLWLQLLSNDKKKLRSFEAGRGTRLGTWLGLLATHTAYDFLRSMRRTPCFDELRSAESIAAEFADPSETTLEHERSRLIGLALAGLTAREQTFVELYYMKGLRPEEIAQIMGISVKTVYTKKHKLQSRLECLLQGERLAA